MSDIRLNQKWLIAGLVILIVFMILILSFVISLLSRRADRPHLGHRLPAATLTYCGADLNQLCIVSFSQLIDGSMQISFQIPDTSYPEFILKINNNGQESSYECVSDESSLSSMVCKGAAQVPGEMLEFKVISKDSGTLLAEGRFAIIGIALFTPEVELTTTPTETPTETPMETPILFNTPIPTPTQSTPSYPNPPYP